MSRESIMEYVADWFNVKPNDDGKYDIHDYDWQAGCYHDGVWLNLEEIVKLIEYICEEECFGDEYEC